MQGSNASKPNVTVQVPLLAQPRTSGFSVLGLVTTVGLDGALVDACCYRRCR